MLFNPRRMKPTTRRVGVAETTVVVPDRANVVRIGLEEELRRGVDAAGGLATKWTIGRLSSLMDRTLDIKRLLALVAPEIVSSHPSTSQPQLSFNIILLDIDARKFHRLTRWMSLCHMLHTLEIWSACQSGGMSRSASLARRVARASQYFLCGSHRAWSRCATQPKYRMFNDSAHPN